MVALTLGVEKAHFRRDPLPALVHAVLVLWATSAARKGPRCRTSPYSFILLIFGGRNHVCEKNK